MLANNTLILWTLLTISGAASAQAAQGGDDWGSFPAGTPPAATPAPAPTPLPPPPPPAAKPAPKPSAAASTPAAAPAAKASAAPAAEAKPAADEPKIISQKERFATGSEPHSPSTWGNDVFAMENHRVSAAGPSISALRIGSAKLGERGVVRLSALASYMSLTDFPVRNAADIRTALTVGASMVVWDFVEAYLGYSASANSNSRTSPTLIQSLGDMQFGVKLAHHFAKSFYAGVDLRLSTLSGVGNQSVGRFAVAFAPRALITFDARELTPYAPVVLHLTGGAIVDTSKDLVKQTLTASEEFALQVNRFNRVTFGAALEIPLTLVTPFVEYGFEMPLGVPAGGLTAPDNTKVDAFSTMPQVFTTGLKITAIKDLTLLAAVDFGLARSVGLGIPATPPFNFVFGASFAADPFMKGTTKIVETIREKTVDKTSVKSPTNIIGNVVDAQSKKPVAGAIVSVAGASNGPPPVATDAVAGFYQSHDLAGEKVKLTVSREGYVNAEVEVKLVANRTVKQDINLSPEEKKATFDITVTGKKKPLAAAVALRGAKDFSATTKDTGTAESVEVAPGTYTVNVSADGFLSQTREVQVAVGGKMPLVFDLQPAPKKSLVVFKDDKIEILQQVHFATGKATILADSYQLLQQVVDAVIKNNVKRLRVEGHTDNRGVKEKNQALSEERSRAVADYLVSQGLDRSRIDAQGYGDSKPVAPNLTAKGREMNRRVEFIVLEK